jgi:hypothetical protein
MARHQATHARRLGWLRRENVRPLLATAGAVSVIVAILVVGLVRHERYLEERDGWLAVPWDESWPALPLTDAENHFG